MTRTTLVDVHSRIVQAIVDLKIAGIVTPVSLHDAAQALARAIDDEAGMTWWNSLTDQERSRWAALAGTGRAKDAWELFKAERRRNHLNLNLPAVNGQGAGGAL